MGAIWLSSCPMGLKDVLVCAFSALFAFHNGQKLLCPSRKRSSCYTTWFTSKPTGRDMKADNHNGNMWACLMIAALVVWISLTGLAQILWCSDRSRTRSHVVTLCIQHCTVMPPRVHTTRFWSITSRIGHHRLTLRVGLRLVVCVPPFLVCSYGTRA